MTLDTGTVERFDTLRAEFEEYGPWVLNLGDRPANPDRVGAWWRLARKRAGIDQVWRLHDLRHWSATQATQAIPAGHDIRTVANRLSHSNVEDLKPGVDRIVGSYLVVGHEEADPAVAQVVSVDARGMVLVRDLPGPAEDHLHLVRHRQSSAS